MGSQHEGLLRPGPAAITRAGVAVRGTLTLSLLALALPAAQAAAQFVEPPPPAAYALQNVTVVRTDGSRVAEQTVVIRGGRIQAIGRGVVVPADARVLAGDSLFVYPGLIDGLGTMKYEFPRDTVNRAQVRSWDAPRVVQGFMPSRRVVDYLAATGTDGAELRRKGVVAVAVHPSPTEPLMPGRGTFVMLRREATTPQQLLVDPVLAPLMTLRGRGVYPATIMAVQPWYRQLFLDAQRQAQLAQVASADPRAALPPPYDPDMAVVQEVLRDGRVFIAANDAEEIRRVLRLAQEFRLRPILVGGAEAWRVADELRARNVPVLVSVDFGTPRQWKPDAKPDTSAAAEVNPAVEREKRQFEERYRNAAKLAEAGVTFALVSGGRGELIAGARKAIEYGLPEAAALRALTQTPATLYGLANHGRLESGMPASLIVTDGPIFERDARVIYTFVEGSLERGAELRRRRDEAAAGATPTAGDAPAGDIINVAGTWRFDITGPMSQEATVRLTQEGTTLSGTMAGPGGELSLSGTIEGERLTLRTTITMGGQSIPLTFAGTVQGDEARGTVETPMGSLDWTARRTGPPPETDAMNGGSEGGVR